VTHLVGQNSDEVLGHVQLGHEDEVSDFSRKLLKLVALDAKEGDLCQLADCGRKPLDLVATKVKTLKSGHATKFRGDFDDLVVGDFKLANSRKRSDLKGQVGEVVVAEQQTDNAGQVGNLGRKTVVLESVLSEIERFELTKVANERRDDLDTATEEVELAQVDKVANIVWDTAETEVITEVEIRKSVERAKTRDGSKL